jgi:replication factor A2
MPHGAVGLEMLDVDSSVQVTFVGQIRNVSTQTTNITYKIDDGTSTVEVKQWIDSDTSTSDPEGAEDANKAKLVENAYCRVWGKLKAFNNKRHVGAHVIRPITDYNEINYHLLEATAVHLLFTSGPPTSKGGQQTGGKANGVAGGNVNITPLARRLYDALKEIPDSEGGLNVDMLASLLRAKQNDICKAAQELIGISWIYTTLDEETWAAIVPH